MKKLLLSAAFAVCSVIAVNAQTTGFQAGAYVGIPVADASDYTSVNLGINLTYHWDVAENFKLGFRTGYDLFTAKEFEILGMKIKGDDVGFIPVAASGKYSFNQFFVGADLGYAIYVGSGDSDGGFLYEPKFGYDAVSFDIYAFYKGISSKQKYEGFSQSTTLGSVGVGFAYKF